MAAQTLHLDLRGRKPDQQVDCLKEQYVALRGRGSVVRAQVEERPVRQYISMLERGYRVTLERDGDGSDRKATFASLRGARRQCRLLAKRTRWDSNGTRCRRCAKSDNRRRCGAARHRRIAG